MTLFTRIILFTSMGGAGSVSAADPTSLAGEVRAAETAFAQTMADRDFEAFKTFVSKEAIFFSGPNQARGREAVAAQWAGLYADEDAPFSWQPEVVAVLDSGTLALSSGPVYSPGGERTATFTSTWRLEADGRWRVVFDKGSRYCPPPE